MLCARDFDTFVDLQEATETPDGQGGFDTSWASVSGGIWCKVEDLAGDEVQSSDRIETRKTTKFTTQYRSDITAENRLVLDGQAYNVRRVDNPMRKNRYTIIWADSGVPN